MESGTLERCSLHGWILVFSVQGRWQTVYGVVWVSGLLKSTLWIEWPMVAVGLWYGQAYVMDHEHRCVDGILNAQRYCDEILRPIVVPFIHDHHLMLQHDNPRPHVAKICTQFLEAENIPVLAWPAYSPDMSPIERVWDALDRRIRQCVKVPANIQQLRKAIEEEWTTFYRPQSTTWSTLCKGDVLHCVRQMVVTPDTDWFICHTCEVDGLSKEKSSLTQI